LKQIREDYRYCLDYWRENREQAAIDMQFIAGDPWTEGEKREREEFDRPMLSPDELSQYVKQTNNNLRQNKRSIKVNPIGSGATDQDAEMRQGVIRAIEYKSNAQAAYTTAYEQAVECGIGALRVTWQYVGKDKKHREPRIKRI